MSRYTHEYCEASFGPAVSTTWRSRPFTAPCASRKHGT